MAHWRMLKMTCAHVGGIHVSPHVVSIASAHTSTPKLFRTLSDSVLEVGKGEQSQFSTGRYAK